MPLWKLGSDRAEHIASYNEENDFFFKEENRKVLNHKHTIDKILFLPLVELCKGLGRDQKDDFNAVLPFRALSELSSMPHPQGGALQPSSV